MLVIDIINKKKIGGALSLEEFQFLLNGYVSGKVPDYQMAAFLMTVYFNGLSKEETSYLTKSMIDSGEKIRFSRATPPIIDKHSTGGVGDKTSLVVAPLVASCGVKIAKLSGKGLGHTGGTLDKLKSINGLNYFLDNNGFEEILLRTGMVIAGQTKNIVPADKLLYSLRDVTGTVNEQSLIAASIMSKKLAIETNGIVLDVKVGKGAIIPDLHQARQLAQSLIDIGKSFNRPTIAILSNMDQPLGHAIGNTLEVKEAMDTLKNNGPDDLVELCLKISAEILLMAKVVKEEQKAIELLRNKLANGEALKTFGSFIEAMGGDVTIIDHYEKLDQSPFTIDIKSDQEGYIHELNALNIGKLALLLGAGRKTKEEEPDLCVGIVLHKKVGDKINKGDNIATLHVNDRSYLAEAKELWTQTCLIRKDKIEKPKVLLDVIR